MCTSDSATALTISLKAMTHCKGQIVPHYNNRSNHDNSRSSTLVYNGNTHTHTLIVLILNVGAKFSLALYMGVYSREGDECGPTNDDIIHLARMHRHLHKESERTYTANQLVLKIFSYHCY